MKLCDHVLYRSNVYAKPEGASFTFVMMMDVSSYLHKLLANELLRDKLIQYFQTVERILSHPACEIIRQIKFDVNLIEVSNGYCFCIKSRKFIECPIPESMQGRLSPRSFVPYDCSTPPQPGYFREGILNSFAEDDERAKFLNKFYQCLRAFAMPHKVRKVVVVGPKNSGKTSWSNIFHRVIPPAYIASLTKEKQFSAPMITNDTHLVIVDEWSASSMQSDLAKCILQGGWMVTAVKHGLPRTVLNNSPYYITTNNLPNFGKEDENVQRRIEVFETKPLPRALPGIDRWIYDNAMDCIAWIASEIEKYRHYIDPNELWYEPNNRGPLTMVPNEGESLFKQEQIQRISTAHLDDDDDDTNVCHSSSQAVHKSFAAEFGLRRLARKRRAARGAVDDDDGYSTPESTSSCFDDGQPPRNVVETSLLPDARQTTSTTVRKTLETQEVGAIQTPQLLFEETIRNEPQPSTSFPTSKIVPQTTDAEEEVGVIQTPQLLFEETIRNEPQRSTSKRTVEVTAEAVKPSHGENELDIGLCSPPGGWVLNDERYMKKVAHVITYGFVNARKGELYAFTERREKAELKRTKTEKEFWTAADPIIDAWMLATGRKRDVFDIASFVKQNRDMPKQIQSARKSLNVLVLTSRCPISKALQELERSELGEEVNEDTDVEVPSQTYWTTIKNWRPW